MARRIPPRLVAAIVVVIAVAGTLLVVYATILAPQIKTRKRIKKDLEEAWTKVETVQRDFGHNPKPQAELALLTQEVQDLEAAVASVEKVSQAKLPADLFPPELDTPDSDQLLRRYRDHLEDRVEEVEKRVKDTFDEKRITYDREIELKYEISFDYGTEQRNRRMEIIGKSNKLMIDLLVFEDVARILRDAEIFALREWKPLGEVRADKLRLLSYEVEVELSTRSLARLAYLLREQEAYYYFADLEVEPVSRNRGGRYFETGGGSSDDLDELRLTAKLRTLRTQEERSDTGEGSLDRRELAKKRAEEQRLRDEAAATNPWLLTMAQLNDPDVDKSKFGEKKPWWKFW